MAVAGRQALSIGAVLGRAFPIWFRNIPRLAILTTIVYSPLIVHAVLAAPVSPHELEDTDFEGRFEAMNAWKTYMAIQTWGRIGLGFMVTAAVIHGVFQQLWGKPVGIGPCLRVCITRFFPVVGVVFLLVLMIVALALPVVLIIGLSRSVFVMSFFVIGMIVLAVVLYCRYWLAVPVTVVERPGVTASLTRSATLTRGSRLRIFVIDLTVRIVPFTAVMIGLLVFGHEPATQVWLGLAMAIVFDSLGPVANAVGYHDLRVAKEGVGVEELVRVFA